MFVLKLSGKQTTLYHILKNLKLFLIFITHQREWITYIVILYEAIKIEYFIIQ